MLKQLSFCLFVGVMSLPAAAQTRGLEGPHTMSTTPASSNSFTLDGTLKDLPVMPAKMYLVYDTLNPHPADSAVVKNGKYTFKGKIDQPAMAYLTPHYAEKFAPGRSDYAAAVYLDKGKITAVSSKMIANVTVTGSTADRDYRTADKQPAMMWDSIRGIATLYKETQDKVYYDQAFLSAMAEPKIEIATYGAFIRQHPASPVAPFLIYHMLTGSQERTGGQIDTMKALFDRCSDVSKATPVAQQVSKILEEELRSAVGHKAPDFTQNDNEGAAVSLSSFKGKYVMLVFWSAKSVSFAYDLSVLKKAYSDYKEKGLNIIGVSVDADKDMWLKAIASGAGSWTQVSDLKGSGNEVAQLYGIKSNYNNVLIDPNGTIVAKDLHMMQLSSALDAIFN